MEGKYESYLREGKANENEAARIIEEAFGGTVSPTTEEIDMKCHTDLLWMTPKGVLCSIDKKLEKKVGRGDSGYSDNYTWVELLDNAGNGGSSECQAHKLREKGIDVDDRNDYIMFETPGEYLFVRRMKLNPFVWSMVEGKTIAGKNPRKPYVPYRRNGHKDLIVLVPLDDIRKITHFKIGKINEN